MYYSCMSYICNTPKTPRMYYICISHALDMEHNCLYREGCRSYQLACDLNDSHKISRPRRNQDHVSPDHCKNGFKCILNSKIKSINVFFKNPLKMCYYLKSETVRIVDVMEREASVRLVKTTSPECI